MEKINVLGVNVDAIDMPMALEVIDGWIARRERHYVTITNVHGVIESQADATLRQIHNRAGLVTPDGMPLVWLGWLNGHRHVTRVCGPDLMLVLSERSAAKGYRHYFYGGKEGVPELLKDSLQRRFPGLDVVGTYSPPFRPLTEAEDDEVVEMINGAEPDIVWVGLSTPKQEKWMAAHIDRLDAPVLIGVGAAFDFHTGLVKRAPRWIQHSGFEWLFRLMSEPRRLWRRYLKIIPLFGFKLLQQMVGLRRYGDDP